MATRNVCIALALISAVACGGGGGSVSTGPMTQPPGNTPAAVGEISVTNNAFSPTTKTVTVGTAVNWAWNTCSGGDGYSSPQFCVSHSVSFDDGINSATQDQGTYSRTFTAAGTYNYHCSVHGTSMAGTIAVQ